MHWSLSSFGLGLSTSWNLDLECIFNSIDKVGAVATWSVLKLDDCCSLFVDLDRKLRLSKFSVHTGLSNGSGAYVWNQFVLRFLIVIDSKIVVSDCRGMINYLILVFVAAVRATSSVPRLLNWSGNKRSFCGHTAVLSSSCLSLWLWLVHFLSLDIFPISVHFLLWVI